MGFEPTTSALGSSLGRSENGAQTTDSGGRYTPRGQVATANFLRRKHVSYGCFLASRLYLLRVLCKDAPSPEVVQKVAGHHQGDRVPRMAPLPGRTRVWAEEIQRLTDVAARRRTAPAAPERRRPSPARKCPKACPGAARGSRGAGNRRRKLPLNGL